MPCHFSYYLCRVYKLTKEEIRIIEQTQSEGEPSGGRVRVWPLVALVLFVVVFAVAVKLFISWIS